MEINLTPYGDNEVEFPGLGIRFVLNQYGDVKITAPEGTAVRRRRSPGQRKERLADRCRREAED